MHRWEENTKPPPATPDTEHRRLVGRSDDPTARAGAPQVIRGTPTPGSPRFGGQSSLFVVAQHGADKNGQTVWIRVDVILVPTHETCPEAKEKPLR